MGSSFESSRHRVRIIRRRKRKSTTKERTKQNWKSPPKRKEKKTGNDHDTTSWRSQKIQTAKERKRRKKKKSLSWFFLQNNTNRKKKIHNSCSSNFKNKLLLLLLLSLDTKKARTSLKNTRARSGSKTQLHEVGTRRRTRRGLKKLDDEEGILPSLHPPIHPSLSSVVARNLQRFLFLRNFAKWRFVFSNWRNFCIFLKNSLQIMKKYLF